MTPSLAQFLEFGFTEEVVVLSQDLRIVTANQSFLRNNSYHLDNVIGEFCHRILNGCVESCRNNISMCPLQESLATGNKVVTSHQDVVIGSKKKHIEIDIYPIPPEWHQEQFFIHITRDITEQMELERLKEEMWGRILKHMEQLYAAMILGNQNIESTNREIDFLAETMPLSLVGWDKDGHITRWNSSAEILFGWQQKEMIGKPFKDLFSSGKSQKSFIKVMQDISLGKTLGYSLAENRTHSGNLVHCEWYHSALYHDESTAMSGGLSMGQDVTEKVTLEEKVKKTGDTLTTLLGSTDDAIVGIDSFGQVNLWNQAAERIFGWPAKEITGKEVELLLPVKAREGHRQKVRQFFASDKSVSLKKKPIETIAITRSNAPFPVRISISSTTIAGKTNVIASIRDRTEEVNLVNTINKYRELKELGELAYGITHKIKDYLTVIDSNLQMVKECRYLSDADTLIIDIEHAIQSGVQDIDTIHTQRTDNISQKDETLELSDPNKIIYEVIKLTSFRWKEQAEKDGYFIEFSTDLAEDIPDIPLIVAEFRNMLSNIVFNAIDALPSGGKIFLSTALENNRFILRCEDNGKGISPVHIDKVFEPFFSTKGPGHSGLGLSTARETIERHGGSISVNSHLEAGATFTVTLPLSPTSSLKEAPLRQERPVLKILIIEDDVQILAVLEKVFRSAKHHTVTEQNGAEGIRTFRADKFDLVVCGLAMKQMGGCEVSARLKRNSPNTPVLMITGWNDNLDINTLKSSGVDEVVTKPFNNKKLIETAENLYLSKKYHNR